MGFLKEPLGTVTRMAHNPFADQNPYVDVEYIPTPWESLVLRYANGRKPCNCRQAYYDENGQCAYGCQANQITAKDEIAECIIKEFLPDQPLPAPLKPYSPEPTTQQ